MSDRPSLAARVTLAFTWFFRILFSSEWATRARDLALPPPGLDASEPAPRPAPAATPSAPSPSSDPPSATAPIGPAPRAADGAAALQLLALLQREGRLVDFLLQDVASFPDVEIGAAARVVHDGCRRALAAHADIEPVRAEAEGATVVVGADALRGHHKLTGNVSGAPPHRGTLRHRGWRARRLELPTLVGDHDVSVLAPAEVEL